MIGINRGSKLKGVSLLNLCLFLVFLVSCSPSEELQEDVIPLVYVELVQPWESEKVPYEKLKNYVEDEKFSNMLFADNSGWILDILVTKTSMVKGGEALVRIDPRDVRLSDSAARFKFEAARARLESQEADFVRFTELKRKNFISEADWQNKRALLLSQRAEFEDLADRLGVISVRAFSSGRVKNIFVEVGEYVVVGQKIITLVGKKGAVDKNAEVFSLTKKSQSSGVKVPLSALIEGNKVMVLITEKSEANIRNKGLGITSIRNVSLGQRNEKSVQILEGVELGELVVAVGAHLLSDDQKVRFFR